MPRHLLKIEYEIQCLSVSRHKIMRYLLIIFLLASCNSHADEIFTSQEDLSVWLTFYYLNPDPEKIPAAVLYMSETGLLDQQNKISPIFGFLAGAFQDNPNKVSIWINELESIKPDHFSVVVLGLWYAKLPNSREMVYEILDSNEKLSERFAYLKEGAPIRITEIPIEQGPWVLDALWGQFFASGSSDAIERIVQALPWIDVKGDTNRLLVGGAATWSLRSNAAQHDRVYEIASQLARENPNNNHLRKIIEDVDKERK